MSKTEEDERLSEQHRTSPRTDTSKKKEELLKPDYKKEAFK